MVRFEIQFLKRFGSNTVPIICIHKCTNIWRDLPFAEELSEGFVGNAEFGEETNRVDPFLAIGRSFLVLQLSRSLLFLWRWSPVGLGLVGGRTSPFGLGKESFVVRFVILVRSICRIRIVQTERNLRGER